MKKLILLATIALVSCSKPEMPNATAPTTTAITCNVEKYTEVRVIVYATSNHAQTDTGFVENGAKVFYSNNCSDCGKTLAGGYSTSSATSYTEIRYIAKCK